VHVNAYTATVDLACPKLGPVAEAPKAFGYRQGSPFSIGKVGWVADVFEGARTHYDERAIAALITSIALINTWNRLTFATRQVAGE
jgi:hypothetical protein